MSQLKVTDLTMEFGGLVALNRLNFSIEPGEFIGLIGPNGSGKTTLLNILSGFYTPTSGEVFFRGKKTKGLDPAELAAFGLMRTFQITKIFNKISVLENLLVPGLTVSSTSREKGEETAFEILEKLHMTHLAHNNGAEISGGQGKLLEFGRLMMLSPKIILLDEPFGGVHPELKILMHEIIRNWQDEGVTVVLISHDMNSIFDLCQRILVLHNGNLIADGSPQVIRDDGGVVAAYLGDGKVKAV